MKPLLIIISIVVSTIAYSEEWGWGTTGIVYDTSLSKNITSRTVVGKYRLNDHWRTNDWSMDARWFRTGIVAGDKFKIGVFLDKTQMVLSGSDLSHTGTTKTSVEWTPISYYAGYRANISRGISIGFGSYILTNPTITTTSTGFSGVIESQRARDIVRSMSYGGFYLHPEISVMVRF